MGSNNTEPKEVPVGTNKALFSAQDAMKLLTTLESSFNKTDKYGKEIPPQVLDGVEHKGYPGGAEGELLEIINVLDQCFAEDIISAGRRDKTFYKETDPAKRWSGGNVQKYVDGDEEFQEGLLAENSKAATLGKERAEKGANLRKSKASFFGQVILDEGFKSYTEWTVFMSKLSYEEKIAWFKKFTDIEWAPRDEKGKLTGDKIQYRERTPTQQAFIHNFRKGDKGQPWAKQFYNRNYGAAGEWNRNKSIADLAGNEYIREGISDKVVKRVEQKNLEKLVAKRDNLQAELDKANEALK